MVALWELGARKPEVVRSDNLSAATHKLKDGKGRDFNERYKAILDHYGLKATRTNSSAHENMRSRDTAGSKDAVAQALVLKLCFESSTPRGVSWTGVTGWSGRSWRVSTRPARAATRTGGVSYTEGSSGAPSWTAGLLGAV